MIELSEKHNNILTLLEHKYIITSEKYMTKEELLQKLNLSPQESKLYLAALEYSPATATVLAQKANIERTASYPHLEELVRMGLLTVQPGKNRKLYIAENPQKLILILDRKKEALSEALPDLMSIFNVKGVKPKIRYYEGQDGMRTIMMNSVGPGVREKLHLNPVMNVLEIFGEQFTRHYIETRTARKVRVKTLRYKEKIEGPWEVVSDDPSLLREVRYLPDDFLLDNLIIIYNNTVAIVSSAQENYGLEIESKELADTMKSFFNLAWQTAKKK